MKKRIALVLALALALSFTGCFHRKPGETVTFQGQTFSKSDLSRETVEWLEWYNGLTESQQMAISYIPSDLNALCHNQGE